MQPRTRAQTSRAATFSRAASLPHDSPPPLEPASSQAKRTLPPSRQYPKRVKTEGSTQVKVKTEQAVVGLRHHPANIGLLRSYLGRHIPIVNGGQVKGGVVAALCSLLPPHAAHRAAPAPLVSLSGTASSSHTAVKLEHELPAVAVKQEAEAAAVKRELGQAADYVVSSSCHHPLPVRLPPFNRMSGALQLSNCVCLFINLQASRYDNSFSLLSAQPYSLSVAWFAPPAQHAVLPSRAAHHCRIAGRG